MAKSIVLFFLLLVAMNNKAQNKFTPIVNQSSSTNAITNKIVSWSFGETAFTTTLVNKNGFILTGGFLQPNINKGFGVISSNATNLKISIGPNPVRDNLTITCNELGVVISSIQVADVFGQIKTIFKGPFSGVNFKTQVPFASVNTGVYFISIFYIVEQNSTKIKVYKVIKA
jgi:Secretion system C-terminal sorting domain